MFEWELVTQQTSTGHTEEITQWTTDYVDDQGIKKTCETHAHGDTIAMLYVSFEGIERQLFHVSGSANALRMAGHPQGDFVQV